MRLREDQLTSGWEKRIDLHTDTFWISAIFALVLGIGFIIAGWRAKLVWLVIMGVLLSIASVAYLTAVSLGIK